MMTAGSKLMAGVMSVTIALSGCQSMGGGQTEADPRLAKNDNVEFFSKSGWQACAGGAAVGAMGCMLKGSHVAECMMVAAVAGCGIGMGANAYLDSQRSKYATKEQRLNAEILNLQGENAKLSNAIVAAKAVVNDNTKQMAQLDREIAAKQASQDKIKRQARQTDANIAALRKTLADLNAREQQWKEVARAEAEAGNNVAQLNQEIGHMHAQIASLQSEMDSLYGQRSALKVG